MAALPLTAEEEEKLRLALGSRPRGLAQACAAGSFSVLEEWLGTMPLGFVEKPQIRGA